MDLRVRLDSQESVVVQVEKVAMETTDHRAPLGKLVRPETEEGRGLQELVVFQDYMD